MLATDLGDLCHPGDLFGALVRRRIHTESGLYQNDELFSLSLPTLDDCDAPEIFTFSKIIPAIESDFGKGFSEHKMSTADTSKNTHSGEATCIPESIDINQPTAVKTPDYFTLTTRKSFAHSTARFRSLSLTDQDVSEMSLFAMKGVQSNIFDLSHPPPAVTVQGYTALAMKAYLLEMRACFVMRKLLDAACEGFRTSSSDGCALAMCTQLTTLLHLFDTSLAQLAADNAPAPVVIADSIDASGTSEELGLIRSGEGGAQSEPAGSLVVLWESSQLHRSVLSQMFAIVKPADLSVTRQDLQVYIHAKSVSANTEPGNASECIAKYLQPNSWAELGGWSMLHSVVQGLQRARVTTNAINMTPIFQNGLFRNASQFRYARPDGSADIATDYAKLVVTATVAQQLSVPLLAELKNKLYCLDADFTASDTVTDVELSDSLLISIDAVWEQYAQRADASTGPEGCIEFLLAALGWSRGRVELLLLDHTVNGGVVSARGGRHKGHDRGEGAQDEQPAHEGQQRAAGAGRKLLIAPVRADAPMRVPKPLVSESRDAEFRRRDIIRAFRALEPKLRLPMNAADEAALQSVCDNSHGLLVHLRDAARRSVGAWYKSYATMSDYYNEHAMNANIMFADVDYHIRRAAPAVVAPVPTRRKLVKKSRDEAPDVNVNKRIGDKPAKDDAAAAGGNEDTVTLTSTVLGATHTVPKSLLAVAEQQIRAKYEGLMRSVDTRITATGWRKRQLQSLPAARMQLVELFAEDARELEALRVAKERNAESYGKYLEDLRAGREASSALAPAAVDKVEAGAAVVPPRGRSPSPSRPKNQPTTVPAAGKSSLSEVRVGGTGPSGGSVSTEAARREKEPEDMCADPARAASEPEKPSDIPEVPPMATAEVNILASGSAQVTVDDPERVSAVPQASGAGLQGELVPGAVAADPSVASAASASPPRSLAGLADAMLHPDKGYLQAEDGVYVSLRSLSSVLVRLGQAAGLVEISTEEVARLLEEASRDPAARSVSDVHARVLQAAARPTCSLHSLQTVFMRSLGQAVLTQCRAINVAAMHCLVSGAVDLLGHIKVVDNLLLVSPNSDFLMSLCTTMVDQHLQLLRVLHRQRVSAAVAGLSHQFADIGNAQMWNSTSLELGFHTTLTNTSAAQDWKKYSTDYASFQLNSSHSTTTGETSADPSGTLTGLSTLWTKGLFSASGLQVLELSYAAPWPVPAIISSTVLGKFACITRRFLEFGHIVALFRVVWGELRLFRVQKTTRPRAAGNAKIVGRKLGSRGREDSSATQSAESEKHGDAPPSGQDRAQKPASSRAERQGMYEVDRCVSDSMRLVQQVVQVLFDYLSERVYVHQARFKEHVALAVERGLDGIVSALNCYSSALATSALQLSAEEMTITRRLAGEGADPAPGLFLSDDPALAMKLSLDALLESCRQVLRLAKAVNDLRAAEKGFQESAPQGFAAVPAHADAPAEKAESNRAAVAGASLSGADLVSLLQDLRAECGSIRAARATVVEAAKRVSAYNMSQGDLQALVMRLEE